MQLKMLSVVPLVLLLLCLLTTIANSEVLPDQPQHDSIDPIKQTGDESEPSDQSKRTIFDSGNVYGIEKHVRLHPSGYKYLLGYRPVKFQLVPVARPLYVKSAALWKPPNLQQFSAKPVVTLLPPKRVPVFKQSNQWKLPVNVPPSVPLRPWQQEGWTPLNKDNTPFLPSVPLPEPAPIVPSQSPIIPIIPTSVLPTVSSVSPPTAFVPQKPIAPIPTLSTIVPVHPPTPIQPTVHVVNVGGRPLVPINYLPGKLNLPVPDLGVLPLGATVPVQTQPGYVHKLPPQQIFLSRFPFPGGVIHQEHAPPVIAPAHPVLPPPQPAPLLPQAFLPQPAFPQPLQFPQPIPVPQPPPSHPHIHFISHQSPQGFGQHNLELPQPVPVPQPSPPHPHFHIISQQSPQGFGQHNIEVPQAVPVPQPPAPHPHIHIIPQQSPEGIGQHNYEPQPSPPHPHIHIISHQSPQGPGQPNVQLPAHNFQFFSQNGQMQFHQEAPPQPQPQPQPQPDQGYQYNPPVQEEVQEAPGFFQPGKTDLQIPGYLPEHPHLRQTFTPSQQDPNIDQSQNVK